MTKPKGAKSLYEIALYKATRRIIRDTKSGFDTFSSLSQRFQNEIFHQFQKQVNLSINKSSKSVKSLFEISLHKAAYEMMGDGAGGFNIYSSLPWKLQADIFRHLQKEVLREDKLTRMFTVQVKAMQAELAAMRVQMDEDTRWLKEQHDANDRRMAAFDAQLRDFDRRSKATALRWRS
ncbi:uncharacterized protein AB675_933 [Cyphellophora attinorum]|uniref:Uncharacterized protein n=1 Tax=Cyphellophora attinorum TaxID=1664694 RepID=A0A0N1HBZ1_9EURO|nr:uncharacterized protein AB675_933 [Phialophora attinorum]KPI45835.1 hypothetical protein AB675_933 [Phialophora attinorum]